jgi:hypothetical protein
MLTLFGVAALSFMAASSLRTRDVRGRPLVNADSSHRTAGENNAKWPEAGDRPCLEHFIRLLLRKHKYPLSRTFTSRRSDSNRGPLHYE